MIHRRTACSVTSLSTSKSVIRSATSDTRSWRRRRSPPTAAATSRGKVEVLEDDWNPKRCVILEFPLAAQTIKWWHSPEYAEARKVRQECASMNMIVVEGLTAPLDL